MRYAFTDFVLDTASHSLLKNGVEERPEPQVFDLLCLLIENAPALVTRDQMIEKIWGGRIVSESAVSARIAAARKAVTDNGKRQEVIRTVARRGLQFVAEIVVLSDSTNVSKPASAASEPTQHARIRYTQAPDGGQIAWTVSGDGPPVLLTSFYPSNVELDLQQPDVAALVQSLCDYSLIRFDQRGCGLSDWSMPDEDETVWASAQLHVADAAGLDRFPIIARTGGALAAVNFAARHPERVSCLILQGGYVDGRSLRKNVDYDPDKEPIEALIREGWGKPDSPFMEAFGAIYLPTMSREDLREIMIFFNQSASAENALRARRASNNASIASILPMVKAPTLIVHASRDAVNPVSEARKLAAGIANAELIVMESRNSILLPGEPVWTDFIAEIRNFLKLHA